MVEVQTRIFPMLFEMMSQTPVLVRGSANVRSLINLLRRYSEVDVEEWLSMLQYHIDNLPKALKSLETLMEEPFSVNRLLNGVLTSGNVPALCPYVFPKRS